MSAPSLDDVRRRVRDALTARDFDTARDLAEPTLEAVSDEAEEIIQRAEGRELLADESRRLRRLHDDSAELRGALDQCYAYSRRQVAKMQAQSRENRAASERAAREWSSPGRGNSSLHVLSEPHTYDRSSEQRGVSFIADVAAATMGNYDPQVTARLERHVAEARIDGLIGDGVETRDVGTSAFSGLVVPQYLTDMVTPAARAMAPTVAICNRHPLPDAGMTVNISRITTGTATAAQATEAAEVQETNIDDTLLTVNVRTYAGQQDLSRQSVERGTGVDQVVMQDLAAAYWTAVDSAILNADGTLGTHLGIRSTVGITAVTYTSASPTAVELWPKLADALQQTQVASYAGVTHFIMHPRRFWWLASRTGTDRPFLAVEGAGDQGGEIGGTDYFASNRQVLGVPVVVDGNVPTTITTTQDVILAVSAQELHFWDDGVQFIRAEQVLASTLQIKLVLFGYSAFTAGRIPGAQATISGTGLAAPSF